MRRKAIIEGLENFGEVEIRADYYNDRLLGNVLVPRNYPGSSNVGAPDHASLISVISHDGGETWEIV
jgi:hypothetical protein